MLWKLKAGRGLKKIDKGQGLSTSIHLTYLHMIWRQWPAKSAVVKIAWLYNSNCSMTRRQWVTGAKQDSKGQMEGIDTILHTPITYKGNCTGRQGAKASCRYSVPGMPFIDHHHASRMWKDVCLATTRQADMAIHQIWRGHADWQWKVRNGPGSVYSVLILNWRGMEEKSVKREMGKARKDRQAEILESLQNIHLNEIAKCSPRAL